jgi:hypothetical protein
LPTPNIKEGRTPVGFENIVNDENEVIKMAKLAGFEIITFNGTKRIALGGQMSFNNEFDRLVEIAQEVERKKWAIQMSAS